MKILLHTRTIRVYYAVIMNMAGYDRKVLEVSLGDWIPNNSTPSYKLKRKDFAVKSGLANDHRYPSFEIHVPGTPAPRFD